MKHRRPDDKRTPGHPVPVREDDVEDAHVVAVVDCPWCDAGLQVSLDGETLARVTCAGAPGLSVGCGRTLVLTGEATTEWWAQLSPLPPDGCASAWHDSPALEGPDRCPECKALRGDADATIAMFPEPPEAT